VVVVKAIVKANNAIHSKLTSVNINIL